MLNLKYTTHTTQKTMVTMATNFNSFTPRVGDVFGPTPFPCCGPFQWNDFDYICKGTCHNHPETTAKTLTSYPYTQINYDYQKHVQPSYIL
jgi:hypothetical protein